MMVAGRESARSPNQNRVHKSDKYTGSRSSFGPCLQKINPTADELGETAVYVVARGRHIGVHQDRPV